jgi:hypothetical protein
MSQDHDDSPAPERSIRETAYFLWKQAGRPEGREQEHWYRAERALLGQHANIAGAILHTRQIDDNRDDLGQDVNGSAENDQTLNR